jgi:hypothetical protein
MGWHLPQPRNDLVADVHVSGGGSTVGGGRAMQCDEDDADADADADERLVKVPVLYGKYLY